MTSKGGKRIKSIKVLYNTFNNVQLISTMTVCIYRLSIYFINPGMIYLYFNGAYWFVLCIYTVCTTL